MHHLKTTAPMDKKVNNKTEKIKSVVPILKTFYSKNNCPFILSGINETHATIFWLDTNKFETFEYYKIEPYLTNNLIKK